MNRSMPRSVVIPVLIYPDVRDAVDWLCGAFGFAERLRIGTHRSQLSYGAGSIIVTGPDAQQNPGAGSAPGFSLLVRVADVDSHFKRVKRFDARIVSPPADFPYGERQYTVDDFGGYRWTFSQTMADVDPAEWGGTLFGE